jgi:hexokinase
LDNVELWDGTRSGPKTVVINTEWGAFGENGELDFILTKWDEAVDSNSINPGIHIYEKMISGLYVGDIVRNVLLELVEKELLFINIDTTKLKAVGAFQTKVVFIC